MHLLVSFSSLLCLVLRSDPPPPFSFFSAYSIVGSPMVENYFVPKPVPYDEEFVTAFAEAVCAAEVLPLDKTMSLLGPRKGLLPAEHEVTSCCVPGAKLLTRGMFAIWLNRILQNIIASPLHRFTLTGELKNLLPLVKWVINSLLRDRPAIRYSGRLFVFDDALPHPCDTLPVGSMVMFPGFVYAFTSPNVAVGLLSHHSKPHVGYFLDNAWGLEIPPEVLGCDMCGLVLVLPLFAATMLSVATPSPRAVRVLMNGAPSDLLALVFDAQSVSRQCPLNVNARLPWHLCTPLSSPGRL